MNDIEFAKLSGSGNDFICIDNRDGRFDPMLSSPARIAAFARALCRRGLAIGADGVILACRPEIEGVSDIAARFFEADGSEAELCGNGAGCFVHWVSANGWLTNHEIKVLTPAGVIRGSNSEGRYVKVCIPTPEDIRTDLTVETDGRRWKCDFAITGVPHAITYVNDVDEVDVAHWGKAIRMHEAFRPRGANANFVQVLDQGRIAVRTFEFGVEGETLACGTGSAAAAILTAKRLNWPKEFLSGDKPVEVSVRSGDVLRIYFVLTDDAVTDVCLETIVRFVYEGRLHLEFLQAAMEAQAELGR